MKAEGLRIGNLINQGQYGVVPVSSYELHNFSLYCNGSSVAEYYKEWNPIPLTEEWLIKFGFEKKEKYGWLGNGQDYQPETSGTNYQDFVLNNSFTYRFSEWFYTTKEGIKKFENSIIILNGGEWYKKTIEGHVSCQEVKYVHQLQNIYYCLIGEELIYEMGFYI